TACRACGGRSPPEASVAGRVGRAHTGRTARTPATAPGSSTAGRYPLTGASLGPIHSFLIGRLEGGLQRRCGGGAFWASPCADLAGQGRVDLPQGSGGGGCDVVIAVPQEPNEDRRCLLGVLAHLTEERDLAVGGL